MVMIARLGKPLNSVLDGGGGAWTGVAMIGPGGPVRRRLFLVSGTDNTFEDTSPILEVLEHIETCTRRR